MSLATTAKELFADQPAQVTKMTTAPKPNIDFHVDSVSVCVSYKTKTGKTEEVVHIIDGKDVDITGFKLDHSRKFKQVKGDDGSLVGYEPTGENSLNLQVKFIKEP